MSFLTYTSHPVLFAASVGGVTLGVTLLLLPWKQISFGDSWSNSFFVNQSDTYEEDLQFKKQGMCRVVSGFETIIKTFSNPLDHVAISCQNKGDDQDVFFISDWVALFPTSLFKTEKGMLMQNKEFSINTVTVTLDVEKEDREEEGTMTFRTEFISNEFVKNKIVGNWKNYDLQVSNKTVDIVNLEHPYSSWKIYFVYDTGKR